MSAFNAYRKNYITACILTAVIYAFAVGFHQQALFCLVDGCIYGLLIFSAGLILWNIFRFAIPVNYAPIYRIIAIVAFAIVTDLFIIGIETIVIYLFFPKYFDSFLPTLPVRLTITSLLYIITYISYLYHENIEGNRKANADNPAKEHKDETIIDDFEKSDSEKTTQISDRIIVRTGQKIKIIPLSTIIYIKADGDYISIRTAEGSWLKEQTMKYTEDRLPIDTFVRIHRSYIVNIHQISRIERYGEQQLIVLYNNEKIKISAARYHALRQILGI
jgi:hypothetical protein